MAEIGIEEGISNNPADDRGALRIDPDNSQDDPDDSQDDPDDSEDDEDEITVTAADFLENPTATNLLALGPNPVKKILQEIEDYPYTYDDLRIEFGKILLLIDSENNDVKNAVYECTDAILELLFSEMDMHPSEFNNRRLLLSYMQNYIQDHEDHLSSASATANIMTFLASRIDPDDSEDDSDDHEDD